MKTGILVINETSFIMSEGLTFIGRDPITCSIILTNVTISKQHALAIKIRDSFYISDLQSTNGTKLEEVSLTPRFCYELIDNARITFGDVKCKFILQNYDAIFKTPTALSKKILPANKSSLDVTKLVSSNIHDLPTQLEDEFQDSTQQLNNKSTEETQILESSIIEAQNISKITLNISKSKCTDDFIIPETQTEHFCLRTQKHIEIDESNNSDQLELSVLDISDTQMVEIHDSIIQLSPKHKIYKSDKNIHEADTQMLGEISKKKIHNLETQSFQPESSKTPDIHDIPTQSIELTSNTSPNTLNIYEMETQLFEKQITNKSDSSTCEKSVHESETQLLSTQQFQKQTTGKPSLLSSKESIYEVETQLLNSQEGILQLKHKIPRIKITTAIDSDLTTSKHSDAHLMEDGMDREIIADSGEPHIENDNSEETQYEFDTKSRIERPKLMQFEANDEKKLFENDESGIITVKRVIGKNRPINFTQDNSQETESQSEPEIPLKKKRVIGDSKPIHFTPSITTQNEIDLNETQFDEGDIQNTNFKPLINKCSKISKISPNTSSYFSDSDSSLNHSVKNNIRNIILSFETASKNSSNTSTPNRNSVEDRPRDFYHKITRSVETEIYGIPRKVADDDVIEFQSISETNCLNDIISNTSVQHKVYDTSKIDNIVEEVLDIPTQVIQTKTSTSLTGTKKYVPSTSKSVQDASYTFKKPNLIIPKTNIDTNVGVTFGDSTQIVVSTDTGNIYDYSEQDMVPKNFHEENLPSLNSKQTSFTFKKPSLVIPETNTVAENDNIFDMPTQIISVNSHSENATKVNSSISNALKKLQDNSTFCSPTQTSLPGANVKPSSDTSLTDIEIYDMPTQVMEKVLNKEMEVFKTFTTVSRDQRGEETDFDVFDIPTQVMPPKQIKMLSEPHGSGASNVVETNDIFDVPTQAFEIVKNNCKQIFDNKTPEKLLHDEDLENILNSEPKTPEKNPLASSSTDDLSMNIKPKRHARKTSKGSSKIITPKTINREKRNQKLSAKPDDGDTKPSQRSSSNQSTPIKDSDRETDKVKKCVDKSAKAGGGDKKRSQRSSSNQSSSTKDSDRETVKEKKIVDKGKSTKKSKQNKSKDANVNSNTFNNDSSEDKTAADLETVKNMHKKLKMIVTTTKKIINTTLNDVDKPSDRVDECSISSNRSTRNLRKRIDAATETNFETKKRKTSNNKQKLIEENNNTNNEKLLQKQKAEENIKLSRKTIDQQSTNRTPNDSTAEIPTFVRPTRKSRIPLKVDSPPEESYETGTRKRCHPQKAHQKPSEGDVGCISSKTMELAMSYVPSKNKFRVMFTIFRDEEQEQTVRKLGGKVVEKSKEANVLVTNQIKRSVKLLNAISQGIPIVSPRWLDICKIAKTFVDPWQFLLDDLVAERKFKFNLQESLNIAKKNGLLLQGYSALVTKSVPTDLKDILENAGAKCINTTPKNLTDKHFIVSSMEDRSQWPKQSKLIIVAAEAIFSSVVRQKLDLKSFLLV